MIAKDPFEAWEDVPEVEFLEEDAFFRKRKARRGSRKAARRSKRKARRAARRTTRRSARKVRKDRRRVSKGKAPKHPSLLNRFKGRSVKSIRRSHRKPVANVQPVRKPAPPKAPAASLSIQPGSVKLRNQGGTVSTQELKEHRVANQAVQHELKTAQELQKVRGLKTRVQQEQLRTAGLAKQVEREDVKTEKLKAQTGLMKTGKGLLWVGVIVVGGYFFTTKVLQKDLKFKRKGKPARTNSKK